MDRRVEKRLRAAGWKVGGYSDFLELSPEDVEFIELRAALAEGVQTRRLHLGLTQAEVAEQVGSSQSRVAKMETGDPSVSVDLLVRTLLGLGASRVEIGRLMARSRRRRRASSTSRLTS